MVTDRPDVTESSQVVPRGFVQIETGYLYSRFDDGGESLDLSSFPLSLVRVGLDRRVELRFEWAGLLSESREADGVKTETTGSGNTTLGAKIKLREERGALPRLALLVDAVLPTGSTSFRADRIDPRIRIAGSNTLTERLGLGYNLGYVALTTEDEDEAGDVDTKGVGRYSVSLAIGLSERWGSFVELFGFLPTEGAPSNSCDFGFTYLSSRTVQLDFSGGIGLSDAAEDWFFSTGISFRLPR
jgi:hypothetical protein